RAALGLEQPLDRLADALRVARRLGETQQRLEEVPPPRIVLERRPTRRDRVLYAPVPLEPAGEPQAERRSRLVRALAAQHLDLDVEQLDELVFAPLGVE